MHARPSSGGGADILNHTTHDLSIKLALTERVVSEAGDKLTVTHCDEPPPDVLESIEFLVKGEPA